LRKIRAGWELTKKSWALLRGHPALLRFPVYAAVAALVVLVVVALPGLYLLDSQTSTVGGIALAAVGVYLAIFVSYYFSVGLAAAADEIFHGREATLADGLRVSRSRVGAIAGWALVSVLVGAVFAAVDSIKGVGPILRVLLSTAWSLITFMAVPVIALEGTGPIETVKRSATLFRSRWAGQVTGNATIGGIVFVVGVLPAMLIGGLGVALWISDGNGGEIAIGAVLVAVGVVMGVLSTLLIRALSGIFGVALYRYAADGDAAGGFTADELQSAVRPRQRP
jgi:hypothetical protein